jgi:hypothetical protein
LQRLKNDFEAFFALHTSYTLFGWLLVAPDYIVFIVIGYYLPDCITETPPLRNAAYL